MEDQTEEVLEVACPKCGDKRPRRTALLKLCVAACPKCKCMWKHELMLKEEHRLKHTN